MILYEGETMNFTSEFGSEFKVSGRMDGLEYDDVATYLSYHAKAALSLAIQELLSGKRDLSELGFE